MRIDFNRICKLAGVPTNSSRSGLIKEAADYHEGEEDGIQRAHQTTDQHPQNLKLCEKSHCTRKSEKTQHFEDHDERKGRV